MGLKIMMAVCFLPCLLLMYGFLYMEGKQKGNILLGVTLWPEADPEKIEAIRKRFKREMKLLLLITVALFVGTCIPKRDSLVVSTQMIWLIWVFIVFFLPLAWGNSRLKALKRESRNQEMESTNQAESSQKVYVDVKAAAIPKEKPFFKLSLSGALCGLVPVIGELFLAEGSFYGWWTEFFLITMFFAGIVCLVIQYKFWSLKTDVVSTRSDVNIQLARVRQYQWSRFFSILIWCNTICTLVMWAGMHWPKKTFFLIMVTMILYMAVIMAAAVWTEAHIRKAYGMYAAQSGMDSGDDDDHWIYGIFYYDKNDNRFMVNRRVGIGTTVNMAKMSAKVFMGVLGAGTLALLIWAACFILMEDFTPITLKYAEDSVISRQYKEEYRIPMSEIESVELVEDLPSMSKRVGSAMDYVMKGSYLSEGYVSCKVCVRRKEPPFLKITAADGMVYYLNDEEPEVTRQVYEELLRK